MGFRRVIPPLLLTDGRSIGRSGRQRSGSKWNSNMGSLRWLIPPYRPTGQTNWLKDNEGTGTWPRVGGQNEGGNWSSGNLGCSLLVYFGWDWLIGRVRNSVYASVRVSGSSWQNVWRISVLETDGGGGGRGGGVRRRGWRRRRRRRRGRKRRRRRFSS